VQKQAARARLAEYRQELDHLDETLAALRARCADEAQAEQQELARQADQARDRLLADAAFRVEQEARSARDVLSRQAMEQALGAAEALLRTSITEQDRDRLGEEYLRSIRTALRADRLGAKQGARP
jgi:F-type H+-transporting ATPase subunit b